MVPASTRFVRACASALSTESSRRELETTRYVPERERTGRDRGDDGERDRETPSQPARR